jgi:hypothetical protein
MKRRLLLLAVALPLAILAADKPAHNGSPTLPDSDLTPGVACPTVTVADISKPGYASDVRAHGTPDGKKISEAEKKKVYEEYGITTHTKGEYEVDHLISLELGGSNDIHNLWPESYSGEWNAHLKDRLENELHRRVVAGKMDLKDVQKRIAKNWIALYIEIFPDDVVPRQFGKQPNHEPDVD